MSRLEEIYDEKTKGKQLPGPLEMGVIPPHGRSYFKPETFADIKARSENVKRLLEKYRRGKHARENMASKNYCGS